MKKIIYLVPTLSLVGCTSRQVGEKPDVIVILADDLFTNGYAISCPLPIFMAECCRRS